MGYFHVAPGQFEVFSNGIGDEYGSVPPTRTTDRDGHVGFAFLVVLRNQVVEKSAQMAEKSFSFSLGVHVLDNRGIGAGEAFQVRYKVGIRQEANIEYQIRINGHAVLESKTHEGYQQMPPVQFLEQRQRLLP